MDILIAEICNLIYVFIYMLYLMGVLLICCFDIQDNRMNHLKNKIDSLNSLKQGQTNDIHIYFWNGIRNVLAHPLFSLCAIAYSVNQTYSFRVTC